MCSRSQGQLDDKSHDTRIFGRMEPVMTTHLIDPNRALEDQDFERLDQVGEQNTDRCKACWNQLSAAIEQSQAHPNSIEPRLMQIEALIGLGLQSMAMRQIQLLSAVDDQLVDQVNELRARISSLNNDQFLIKEREHNLRLNLARIADRVQINETQIDEWRSVSSQISWYRSLDGNIVRCNESTGRVAHLSDIKSAHRCVLAPLVEQMEARYLPPIFLEGVDPHWILESLLNANQPKDFPNFQQGVIVFQSDWKELCDGLSCHDFGDKLGDSRLRWFVGDDAPARLLAWFEDRRDDVPPTMVVQNPLVRTKANPDSKALLKEIDSRWVNQSSQLIEQIRQRIPKDRSLLLNRYQRVVDRMDSDESVAIESTPDPLRVLIPTSRYTSYIQHAARDLASALSARGCVCHVQIEKDDSQVYSKSKYLRTILDFDPDLIVSINYPRVLLNEHSPIDIPHVCWVQDAMEHLFNTKVGQSIGELDFVVGMVKDEFVEHFAYPREQARWMPMVASGSKFSAKPLRDEFDCEIAWVTHQSEHPDLLRDRIIENMRQKAPGAVSKMTSLLCEIERIVTTQPRVFLFSQLNAVLDETFFPNGVHPQARALRSNMFNTLVNPYAERVFRHQVAQWASNIASRRGWRLKLFGKGWDNHPDLSEYAAGEIGHGEPLSACYQRSVVHLHASINQVMHQRVSECFLSGGIALCRTTRDAFALMNNQAAVSASQLQVGQPIDDAPGNQPGLRVRGDDCSELKIMIDHLRRLELCEPDEYQDDTMCWSNAKIDIAKQSLSDPVAQANAQMFASHADLFFSTESQLEVLIERAIQDPDWREQRINNAVSEIPKEMTIDGFARNVLGFIRSTLGSGTDQHN